MNRRRARPTPSEMPTHPGRDPAEHSIVTMPGTQVRPRPTLLRWSLLALPLLLGGTLIWFMSEGDGVQPPSANPRPPALNPEALKLAPSPSLPRPAPPKRRGRGVVGKKAAPVSPKPPKARVPSGESKAQAAVRRAIAAPDDAEKFEAGLAALRAWARTLPPDEATKLEAAVRRAEFTWSASDLQRALHSVAATKP